MDTKEALKLARSILNTSGCSDPLYQRLLLDGRAVEKRFFDEWKNKARPLNVLFVDDELNICNAVSRALTAKEVAEKVRFNVETVHVKPDGKDYVYGEIIPRILDAQARGNPIRYVVLDVNLSDIVDGPSVAVQLEQFQHDDPRITHYYIIDFLSGNRNKEQILRMTEGLQFSVDPVPFIKVEQNPLEQRLSASLVLRTPALRKYAAMFYAEKKVSSVLTNALGDGNKFGAAVEAVKRQLFSLPTETAEIGMTVANILEAAIPDGVQTIGPRYTLDELADNLGMLNATRILNLSGSTGNEEVAFRVEKNYSEGGFGITSNLRILPNIIERIANYAAMYTTGSYRIIVLKKGNETQVLFRTTLKDRANVSATMTNMTDHVKNRYEDLIRSYLGRVEVQNADKQVMVAFKFNTNDIKY